MQSPRRTRRVGFAFPCLPCSRAARYPDSVGIVPRGVANMRARILALASLSLLLAASWYATGQTVDEKKKDAAPKREPDRLTAETEVNGKNLDQWIKLIPNKDRSMTKTAIEAVIVYAMSDPELAKRAVPVMIAELKKHNPPNNPLDLSVRTTIPQPLALILSSLKEPDPREVKEAVGLMNSMMKNDGQLIVKFRAAQAVAQMGPLARDTLPELTHLVRSQQSETWELRELAVAALGTVGFDAKRCRKHRSWKRSTTL